MPWKKAAVILAFGALSTALISLMTLVSVTPEFEDIEVD